MNKAFTNFAWEDYPSENTALDAERLNNINNSIDIMDDRVIKLDSSKLDKSTAYTMVQDVSLNSETGIFTITKLNGSTIAFDTILEKIAINWKFDKDKQQLIIILDDGTEQVVDLSALITQYEFRESDTIILSVDSDGKVYGTIRKGSITGDMLESNYLANVTEKADTATQNAAEAKASATAASTSEKNAANSATKAESYAVGGTGTRTGEDTDNAKYYSQSAKTSATTAANNANTATTKANEAATSATNAKTSETNAANSASTASTKATNAASSATNAANSATAAKTSETNAKTSETNAATSATNAANYATGSTNSAKYYYEQAKNISESFAGTLRPKGTVAFENLPSLYIAEEGDMYNISDQFVTTSEFKEGSGNTIPAGANVYKTSDGKWDILAGNPVTGVKGNAESSYRNGNVNITPANIGLGNVDNTADSDKTVKSAATATKLTTDAGSPKVPIYFSSGKPVACTYGLHADISSYVGSLASGGWKALGGRTVGARIAASYNNSPAAWNSGHYSSSIVFGANDTKGLLDCAHSTPIVTFGGGSTDNSTDDNPTWHFKLVGTSGQAYRLPSSGGTLASTSDTVANALKLSGYSASSTATANTIALRTADGYINARYLNQSSSAETPNTSSYIMYANSDGYLRKSSLANIKSILGLGNYLPISGGSIMGDLSFDSQDSHLDIAKGYITATCINLRNCLNLVDADQDQDVEIMLYKDDYGECGIQGIDYYNGDSMPMFEFSRNVATVCNRQRVHHDGNSAAVAVTSDDSSTPSVSSYGLWAY